MPSFKRDRFYVLDGGFNTRLCHYEPSAGNGDDPLWGGSATLRNPEAVKKAHRDFLEAGAQGSSSIELFRPKQLPILPYLDHLTSMVPFL